jgi:choice-of-anchor C domain-containing protein
MKNKISILIVVLIAAFATVSVSAQVSNGSFETGDCNGIFTEMLAGDTNIDSWTVGGGVDYICTYWQAAEGTRSVDLNGRQSGSVSQGFATTPGFTYQVTFSMSGNPDGSDLPKVISYGVPPVKTLGVSANGSTHRHIQLYLPPSRVTA